jgi:short-subunit dehydrogenase
MTPSTSSAGPARAEGHALVTGASSGIGRAYAQALRRRGRKLILVARRADRLNELAAELGGPDGAIVLPADLARPGGVRELLATLGGRGLVIDLLVNNAGLGHTGRFAEQPPDVVTGMVDLNVTALVALTRGLLPAMLARRGGAIVNVASTASFQPVPYLTVYAATKAFVLSFTEGLAAELVGTGVHVQVLCPGPTATEFHEVAGTDGQILARRMPSMTAAEVVEISLRGLDRGRLRVVTGLANRALPALQRFLPSALVRRVAAELYRPRGGTTQRGHDI